ncbi:MAG TPA: protein phosphatase 2C domain-containing protein [Candidatus Baltobacteraceae bacterium]|nr:protein phosphatase 2C domain-containing protein [Candidatus Baltobacteraceae bacterium]
MEIAVGSDSGSHRDATDAHLAEVLASGITVLGVADGFGEPSRDALNASHALCAVRDHLRRCRRSGVLTGNAQAPIMLRTFLLNALEHANERIYEAGGSTEDYVAGGVSLTVALLVGHQAFIGHVGDARAYVMRLGRLEALTVDDAVFASSISPSKSNAPFVSQLRGVLWRSLGTQSRLEASIVQMEFLPGDQLVLCTDGMHRAVFSDEIERMLIEGDTAADVATRMLSLAKVRGFIESATVLIGRDLLTEDVPITDPLGGGALWARIGVVLGIFGAFVAAVWLAIHWP